MRYNIIIWISQILFIVEGGFMRSIVYISDFRLPFGLNFVKPLKKFAEYKKILIIERHNLHNEHVLEEFFDEIIYIDHIESHDAIREHIAEIRRSHSIEALLTPGENAIEIGGQIRTEFGIPGMQRNQAEAVRNKWIMKQMLHQRGIRTSEIAIALHEEDYIHFTDTHGFPIIVKPLSGYGSMNTFKLSSMDELTHYLHHTRQDQQRDLLEEFINGTEFHCDSIVSRGKVVFSSVSQYLYNCLDIATKQKPPASITFPEGTKAEFIHHVKELNEQVIAALGINQSVTHAELFLTPEGEVVFGEIGARIGGSHVMPPCQFIVSYQVGQRAGAVNDTMTRSGFAIVEGDSFEGLRQTLLDMYDRFKIEVTVAETV